MTLFDDVFGGAYAVLQDTMGETATYRAGGTGSPVAVTVVVIELPMLVTDERGQSEDRIAQISVPTSSVASPQRGDTYTLTSTAHAGTYIHMRIDRRNDVRWLIAARKKDNDALAANGAHEVRS